MDGFIPKVYGQHKLNSLKKKKKKENEREKTEERQKIGGWGGSRTIYREDLGKNIIKIHHMKFSNS